MGEPGVRRRSLLATLALAAIGAGSAGCSLLSERTVQLCEDFKRVAQQFDQGLRTLDELEAAWRACKDSIRQDEEDGTILESVKRILQEWLDRYLGRFDTLAESNRDATAARVRALLLDIENTQQ